MSMCIRCRRQYSEPADEQGDHDCPHCGLSPELRAMEPCEACGQLDHLQPISDGTDSGESDNLCHDCVNGVLPMGWDALDDTH